MALDDPLDHGQSNACPLGILDLLEPVKQLENLLTVLRFNSDAVVPNEKAVLQLLPSIPDLDPRFTPLLGKLHRLSHQVFNNLFLALPVRLAWFAGVSVPRMGRRAGVPSERKESVVPVTRNSPAATLLDPRAPWEKRLDPERQKMERMLDESRWR